MKLLIQQGRVIDPRSGTDKVADVAIAAGRVMAIGHVPSDFHPAKTLDATGYIVAPGLVDLAARLREPGHEHEGMLESEMAAAVAGGVTSLVCPPDTDPVLDEPGLVNMLKFRSEKLHLARVFPLGALTRGLKGEVLTEMAQLAEAGCIGFSQADVALQNTLILQRAMQYAATYDFALWLHPQESYLSKGVAASGALATRLGLAGVPVMAEVIAIHTIFEIMKTTGARVHLCRLSSAAAVSLVREAKTAGLPVTCDVSINSLHLTEVDIGYFDSRARLLPVLRQQTDRDALQLALADGTIDALVSDHTPVAADDKTLPFAEAEPGATGLELLLCQTLAWATRHQLDMPLALSTITQRPAALLGAARGSAGQLTAGAVADICVFDPVATWQAHPKALRSQGKHTPFSDYELQGRVRWTLVGGQIAYEDRL